MLQIQRSNWKYIFVIWIINFLRSQTTVFLFPFLIINDWLLQWINSEDVHAMTGINFFKIQKYFKYQWGILFANSVKGCYEQLKFTLKNSEFLNISSDGCGYRVNKWHSSDSIAFFSKDIYSYGTLQLPL